MLPDPPRKPLDATLSRTNVSVERRGNRLVPARCRACGRDELRALLRTDYVVYFRCEYCAQVWSVAKPGDRFGT
jgi:hypothetical protein